MIDGKNMSVGRGATRDLYKALARLRNASECKAFMTDLCTPMEIRAMADRWRVAKLLAKGVPYRAIHDRTGVSTATVTRVARCVELGTGGYHILLKRERYRKDRKQK
jgi:TrpR-related protein YerC/YecD